MSREEEEVPGVFAILWLVFMKPYTLRRMMECWGQDCNPSLLQARQSVQKQGSALNIVVRRVAVWELFVCPVAVLLGLLMVSVSDGPAPLDYWLALLMSMSSLSVLLSVLVGMYSGVVFGVFSCLGLVLLEVGAFELRQSLVGPLVVLGSAIMTYSATEHLRKARLEGASLRKYLLRPFSDFMSGGAFGAVIFLTIDFLAWVFGGEVLSILTLVTFVIGWGVIGFLLSATWSVVDSGLLIRSEFYVVESVGTLLILALQRVNVGTSCLRSLLRLLPYRHHELIPFPLLGLRPLLVDVGRQDPTLGQELITEASNTLAQGRPARQALEELQAHTLHKAANQHQYQGVADLSLPFLPGTDDLPEASPLRPFQSAARDLLAASAGTSQHHRRERLTQADTTLQRFQLRVTNERRPERLTRLLLPVAQRWRDEVAEQRARLDAEVAEHAELPTPFRVGKPLQPDDHDLFKGRRDIVRLFNQDLAREDGEPILLLGQRRVGKSSLLNWLPTLLGSATVVSINFQSLSGSPHRSAPHRWVLEAVSEAFPDAAPPPPSSAWIPGLDWLASIDAQLAKQQQRLLIAIDEVERLEEDRVARDVAPDFLDFVRACGDRLRRVRLLLVGARPPARLGRHWTDRLISAVGHDLSFLKPDEARELIRQPTKDFPPDVYPDEAVEEILRQTQGHPYLVQLICSELVALLNAERRTQANMEDLEEALDRAAAKARLAVFQETWDDRTAAEQRWLKRLAEAPEALETPAPVLRQLRRESYVVEEGGTWRVAVPLFAEWVREWGVEQA